MVPPAICVTRVVSFTMLSHFSHATFEKLGRETGYEARHFTFPEVALRLSCHLAHNLGSIDEEKERSNTLIMKVSEMFVYS